jgi:CRP-like cAMP-binding protein
LLSFCKGDVFGLICKQESENLVTFKHKSEFMNTITLPELIAQLGDVPADKAERLATFFELKQYPKNYVLLQENEISNEYCLLGSGLFRSWTLNTENEEVTLAFFTPGQIAAEPLSFFTRVPSRENIQALTDSEGWSISYEQVQSAFHALPEFREFGRRLLLGAYSRLKERMLSAVHLTAEERYRNLLKQQPDIFQHAQLRQIASFLGITDTSLSRIRKEIVKH